MKKPLITLALFLLMCQFSFSQNWLTDFSKAKEISKKEQKKIVLVFSGSDWCGPCIKLDAYIWKNTEFKEYANENLVMLKADFPRKKKNKLSAEQQVHNDKLAEKYRAQFPLVAVLNFEGKVLGRIGFKKKYAPQDYIDFIAALK